MALAAAMQENVGRWWQVPPRRSAHGQWAQGSAEARGEDAKGVIAQEHIIKFSNSRAVLYILCRASIACISLLH